MLIFFTLRKNGSLKGSLRNPKWFAVKTHFWNLHCAKTISVDCSSVYFMSSMRMFKNYIKIKRNSGKFVQTGIVQYELVHCFGFCCVLRICILVGYSQTTAAADSRPQMRGTQICVITAHLYLQTGQTEIYKLE